MPRKGRDLERLVALVEQSLGPQGAIVKSPDYLEDQVTHDRREVDVSIRKRVGSIDVVIVLECRDRDSVEDVRWIEQLAQKGADVRASKVVAVSSEGFSEGARVKAAHLGIETRRIDEISADAIRGWYLAGDVQLFMERVEIVYCNFQLDATVSESPGEILARIRSCSAEKILVCKKDGEECGLAAVWSWFPGKADLYADIPRDGTRARKPLEVNYPHPAERYQVRTLSGLVDVLQIQLVVDLWIEQVAVPVEKVLTYENAGRSLAQVVQYQINLPDGKKRLTFVRDTDSGGTSVSLKNVDEGRA